MPPKANDAIDSLITEEDGWGMWDFFKNWLTISTPSEVIPAYIPESQIEEAKKNALKDFYKHSDAGAYQKTYDPGEHELLARMLGIEDEVNQYMYAHTESLKPDAFETLIKAWQQGKYPKKEDVIDLKDYRDKPWDVLMHDAPTGIFEAGMGKEYSPEESPLLDMGDYFSINPETKLGKNLQGVIDLVYTASRLYGETKTNPDTGEEMLSGPESLLGDIFFDEYGRFTDVWDIKEGEHESTVPPASLINREGWGAWLESLGFNIGRKVAGPSYEKNVPTVKGRGYLLDDIRPYVGGDYREGF